MEDSILINLVCNIVYVVVACVICVKLAAQKNKDKTLAGIVGFLFGIFAILYYSFAKKEAPKVQEEHESEKLPSTCGNMLVVLTVIAIVAAGVLASVNAVTAPQIEKINAENLAAGIKAVMGSDEIQVSEPWEKDAFVVYDIDDKDGNKLGKAVVTAENGFNGAIKVLVGFNAEGDILGYTVLEHAETPGLGAKANEWFQDKIIGLNPGESNFTVSKDGGDVDAITASTITSRAFLRAIQNAYDRIMAEKDATSGATKQVTAADIETPEVIE